GPWPDRPYRPLRGRFRPHVEARLEGNRRLSRCSSPVLLNCIGFGPTIGCNPATNQMWKGGVMRIVILGAGQAAASMAARLRASGHDGPLTVIGAESAAPYQRPPLSKAYLLGEMGVDRLVLRAPEWW